MAVLRGLLLLAGIAWGAALGNTSLAMKKHGAMKKAGPGMGKPPPMRKAPPPGKPPAAAKRVGRPPAMKVMGMPHGPIVGLLPGPPPRAAAGGPGAGALGIAAALGLGGLPPPPAAGAGLPLGGGGAPGGALALALGLGAPPAAAPIACAAPPAVPAAWSMVGAGDGALDRVTSQLPAALEIVVRNVGTGAAVGSALFRVNALGAVDMNGSYLDVHFLAASEGALEALLRPTFTAPGARLHICQGPMTACAYLGALGLPVLHVDTFRLRRADDLTEPWAVAARAFVPAPGGPPLFPPLPPIGAAPPAWRGTMGSAPGPSAPLPRDSEQVAELKEKLRKLKAKGKRTNVAAQLSDKAAKRRRRDDDDESSDDAADFRSALGRGVEDQKVQRQAETDPGHWFSTGMQQMMSHLAIRSGADSSDAAGGAHLVPCAVTYFTSVYCGNNPMSTIGVRNAREMRTWCEVLDALVRGDLPQLGDIAIQRLKAVMLSVQDGGWNQAKFLELIPMNDVQLVTTDERRSMLRERVVEQRLMGKAPPGSGSSF
jgi:hypothetical protein